MAKELDKQSGNLKSGEHKLTHKKGLIFIGNSFKKSKTINNRINLSSNGGANRFFYVAKPTKSEKNAWIQNKHPTVKPLKLIKYLVKLISFPNAIGIDPFAGSGTFGIACKDLSLGWVCIELEEESIKIIKSRLSFNKKLFEKKIDVNNVFK